MRILLISNPNARRGAEPLDPALSVFSQAGMSLLQVTVTEHKEVGPIIERHAPGVDAVVLAGGDGTIHEAVPSLLRTNLPLGILPCGTANDFAKNVHLPLDLAQCAEIIRVGFVRRVDIGQVNDTCFVNVAHIGLGAALGEKLRQSDKSRFGPLAYLLAAARALRGLRPFRAAIDADGRQTPILTFGISIGNGRYFGGQAVVAEDADIDDGLLHIFALTTKSPLLLLFILPRLLSGRHGRSRWVETLNASKVEVNTVRLMPIRADGELVGHTPASFKVQPMALAVFAPAG